MPFLRGEPLDERLKRAGGAPLPLREIVRIGREVAEGLAAAHEQGLIHRDIKPTNVWLEGERGRVKVLDFGLARAAREDTQLTQTGAIVGTPAYMAPEQARGEAVDARCDLFSLGCLLYQMSTGQRPFNGPDTMSILMSLALDQPTPPNQRNAELPAELSDLITRLLAKAPEDRPASARAVANVLAAIERGLPDATMVPSASRGPAVAVSQSARPRRRLAVAVAAALLLTGGLIAAVVIIRDRTGKEVARVNVPAGGSVVVETDDKQKRPVSAPSKQPDKDTLLRENKAEGKIEEAWIKRVAALEPKKQAAEVEAELKRRNGGFLDNFSYRAEKGNVVEVGMFTDHVTDLTPLRALPHLSQIGCAGRHQGSLKDLSPLAGMKLKKLYCYGNQISDLSPLKGMPLIVLHCGNNPITSTSLASLEGMPLEDLELSSTGVESLSPLRGMKLTKFSCRGCGRVSDLSPLEEMPLEELTCSFTPIRSLAPLKGMKLKWLNCGCTKVRDLSPLAGMPLEFLDCGATNVVSLAPLKGMKLKNLRCGATRISDLAPLAGMPLETLACEDTLISSLAPLKGMLLESLVCVNTNVSDLSPLAGMPLLEIRCDFRPERDAAVLRSLKTLQKINGKPAPDFWKEVEAKAANEPARTK